MPRLFTGLQIPGDITRDLDMMKGGVFGARWIERDSQHLTLRFIGDIDDALARDLAEALDQVSTPPFELRLKGMGAFGGPKPHALYAGVAGGPELRRLQGSIERVCQQVGLAPEARKFTPHVTLARLKHAEPGNVQRFIADHNLYESRAFEVTEFVLYSARPSRGGGPYAVEELYPLGNGGMAEQALRAAGGR